MQMVYDEQLKKFIQDAKLFFKQQEELYGNLIIERSAENQISRTNFEKKDVRNEPVATQVDLFGNVVSLPQANSKDYAKPQKYPDEPWVGVNNIGELEKMINKCTKCALGYTRKNFVFGVGNPQADVVVVGEAPGADEDEQGEPFVGRAGQLLNKILEAVQLKREEVYICNVLKCRPPNNRDPQADEIEKCEPYLWKQLELINPKIILCAGRIAAQALLKTSASLAELRSKVHNYREIPLVVTYHPAALLRNPQWKRPCWEDMQNFRNLYDKILGK